MRYPAARSFVLMALLLILCAAAAARWHAITSASFWTDEFMSLEVSAGHGYEHRDFPEGTLFPAPGELTSRKAEGTWSNLFLSLCRTNHPPLYYCVLRIWRWAVQSDSDWAVRSLSVVFSLIAIVLAFDAARLLHGPGVALAAAGILAFAGPQIQYAQEARSYAMLVALMLACCDALARIELLGSTRRRRMALYLAATAMLFTHYLGFAVLAALILYGALRLRRSGALLAMIAAAVTMLAVWGPFIWIQRTTFSQNLSWMSEPPAGAITRALERLGTLPIHFFFDPGNNAGIMAYAAAVLLVLPAFLLRRYPRLLLWCLITWTVVAVIAIGDMSRSTMALSMPRYTLCAAAAANILAAAIAAELSGAWKFIAPAAIIVGCALALPYSYDRDKPDFRTMAAFLSTHCRGDSTVVFYSTPEAPWYPGVLDVGLSHYTREVDRPTVILAGRAHASLLQELRDRGVIDVITPSLDPARVLPGCQVIEQRTFPFVGVCARVSLKNAGVLQRAPGVRAAAS